MQYALFGVNYGEIGVWRNSLFGHMRNFFIVFHTRPARLFVAADYQFYFARGHKTLVFERFKAIQHYYRGALVVHSAPAPNARVFVVYLPAERLVRPAAARGNDVEVGEHGELFALAEYNVACVVVVVVRFKSHTLRKA